MLHTCNSKLIKIPSYNKMSGSSGAGSETKATYQYSTLQLHSRQKLLDEPSSNCNTLNKSQEVHMHTCAVASGNPVSQSKSVV